MQGERKNWQIKAQSQSLDLTTSYSIQRNRLVCSSSVRPTPILIINSEFFTVNKPDENT